MLRNRFSGRVAASLGLAGLAWSLPPVPSAAAYPLVQERQELSEEAEQQSDRERDRDREVARDRERDRDAERERDRDVEREREALRDREGNALRRMREQLQRAQQQVEEARGAQEAVRREAEEMRRAAQQFKRMVAEQRAELDAVSQKAKVERQRSEELQRVRDELQRHAEELQAEIRRLHQSPPHSPHAGPHPAHGPDQILHALDEAADRLAGQGRVEEAEHLRRLLGRAHELLEVHARHPEPQRGDVLAELRPELDEVRELVHQALEGRGEMGPHHGHPMRHPGEPGHPHPAGPEEEDLRRLDREVGHLHQAAELLAQIERHELAEALHREAGELEGELRRRLEAREREHREAQGHGGPGNAGHGPGIPPEAIEQFESLRRELGEIREQLHEMREVVERARRDR